MTGIVIATHCKLGEALIDAAEFILGKRPEGVVPISIDLNDKPENGHDTLINAINCRLSVLFSGYYPLRTGKIKLLLKLNVFFISCCY